MGNLQSRTQRQRSLAGVPRAVGLMAVLVFVIAMGGVGLIAHLNHRADARVLRTQMLTTALKALADRVESSTRESAPAINAQLARFATRYPCKSLRLVGTDGKIRASMAATEVGGRWTPEVQSAPPATGEPRVRWAKDEAGALRLIASVGVRNEAAAESQALEAVFITGESFAAGPPLGMLMVALAAAVALGAVYRRLRIDLSSTSRIADRLARNGGQWAEHLADLRLTPAKDAVSRHWNELIDYTTGLQEEVARSEASSELIAVLARGDSGELATAMTAAPVGVALANAKGEVLYANAMARRSVGWPGDPQIPISLRDQELPDAGARIVESIAATGADPGSARMVESRVEGQDGSHFHVRALPVRTAKQSHCVLALILDVSQQVRADKAREEFVSQVTHELRTPLTNIRAYTETLSSGMFEDPQVITECYNVITKETRRLSRLIEDVLSVSQLEVGTMQLVMDQVDLGELLDESVRDVRGIAESKNIAIELILPAKLDPVTADRDKLAVVINNLLGNALKYTPDNGNVTMSCKAGEGGVRISVRDTGIGIDPQDQERIFEKFQRAQDEAVLAETGTGIGLTTAREIAQQHGGDIAVVSKKGEGATFTLTLPAERGAAMSAEVAAV
jgi:signal transduction histidine kinase